MGWNFLTNKKDRASISADQKISLRQNVKGIDNRLLEKRNLTHKLVPVSQRRLGKTGVFVSLLGIGGSGIIAREDAKEVVHEIFDHALANGVNYIDTAPTYGASESNIGEAIRGRREKVFLATKTLARGYDETMRLFHQSLERLQTEYIDLYQIHGISNEADLAMIEEKRGAARAVSELKQEGLVRFIGVTGHNYPDLLHRAIKSMAFDCLLMPLNVGDIHDRPFQTQLLTRAREKDLGIIVMKAMAYGRIFRENGIISAKQALHYTCSFPCSTTVVGVSSLEEMKENISNMKSFEVKSKQDLNRLEALTAPYKRDMNFFKHEW